VIAAVLLAFMLGMIGSPWFESSVRSQLPAALQAERESHLDPRVAELEARIARLEARQLPATAGQPGEVAMAGRLAALEAAAAALQSADGSMLDQLRQVAAEIERTKGSVSEGDRQLRGLFLVSVARRLVETGRPLGPVESALQASLGTTDPDSVAALSRWSNVPQTRATLLARLGDVEAETRDVPVGPGGWWARLKTRLSGLVRVSNGIEQPAIDPDAAAAARAALVEGDLPLAVARLERAAPSPARTQWLADARALMAAEAALDRIEAGLLEAAALAAAQPAPPPELPAPPGPAPPSAPQASNP
jgi:type II secretory pathway component PulJ